MGEDWSDIEIELILVDYFDMLSKELNGMRVNKSQHRLALLPLLNKRSAGSIEFKHQNISAVLARFGQPFISGYKPRYNYQQILENKISDYLIKNRELKQTFESFSEKEVNTHKSELDFETLLVAPPNKEEELIPNVKEPLKTFRTNYLLKEQLNTKLGLLGEEFALKFEKWTLKSQGKDNLADCVEWISKTEGDGLGFDILSRNFNGTDKYIEVKTTKLSKETPFYFTINEFRFSQEKSQEYYLYRIFNFDKNPKLFSLNGSLDSMCYIEPISFKGYF